ncbi:hypothetical protein [Selenihalanaerobacter shriftii]|uniref:Tetratricopeptide repeat-containing protein n=1 Tax=Selenihalanaerobacter shriftii TaxID=142842 RepID=A0A1T4PAI2_9FIRM|nr:hypothetical protein [Selenihalanaerobacter shriftii]SJZ88575.1 hypothetical protein SAMN02745118_02097 [Selenihalanaerobacter shriftii]
MNCKCRVDLSELNLRFAYLDKLNFTKDLIIDLLPQDEEVNSRMKSLNSTLEELIQLLTKLQDNSQKLSEVYRFIENGDDILEFIYSVEEDEIYLKIKERFDLNPDYSWHLFNRIYDKLNKVSQKIDYLSEVTSSDVSDIQKLLMQIAIIFNNNNLNEDQQRDRYLIRHLNAVYHCLRGDFNESLYVKGYVEAEWNILKKAKNEYQKALELDDNLVKAKEKLSEIEKNIV